MYAFSVSKGHLTGWGTDVTRNEGCVIKSQVQYNISSKNPEVGVKKSETSIFTGFVPTLQKMEK